MQFRKLIFQSFSTKNNATRQRYRAQNQKSVSSMANTRKIRSNNFPFRVDEIKNRNGKDANKQPFSRHKFHIANDNK